MATVNEIIFNVKQMINSKGYQEEYNFTDSYILFLINIERANIFNRTQEISNTYYQRLKLNLTKEGETYISEVIPNIIGYTTPTKEVYTVRGLFKGEESIASYISNREWQLRKYRRFTKKQNVYTIIENRVYLDISNYDISYIDNIELEAIFNNPVEVYQKNNGRYIFMEDDFEYPLPDKYISIISNNIFNLYIKPSYQMATDQITNKDER